MRRADLRYDEHATSRYMCVTVDVIDKLQRAYFAGRNLGRCIAAFNETEAAAVVAESLEADRILNLPPSHLFGGSFEPLFGPLTDWPRAVMAEILLDTADLARGMGDEKKTPRFLGTSLGHTGGELELACR